MPHRYFGDVDLGYESPRDRRSPRRHEGRSRSGSRSPLPRIEPVNLTPEQNALISASLARQHIAPLSIYPLPHRRPALYTALDRAAGFTEENASNPLQWTKFMFDTPREAKTVCTLCEQSDDPKLTDTFYGHENRVGTDHLFCLEHYTDYQTANLTPDKCPDCRRTPMAIWREQRVMGVADDGTKRVLEHGEIRRRADVRGNSGGKKRKSTNRRYKHARVTRRGRYNRVRVTRRNHQSKKQK